MPRRGLEAIIDQPALGGALQNATADPRELYEVVMDENRAPAKNLAVSPTALGADVRSLDTTPDERQEGIMESELEPRTSSEA